MTQEEKAKRYDEAIEKAESLYKAAEPMSGCNVIIETLFPELKENNDERIRKALINGFNKLDKSAVWYNGITNAQVLDWLERQGEHANFRKKIQIGDKVTRNKDGVLVNLSQLNRVAKDRRYDDTPEVKEVDSEKELPKIWDRETLDEYAYQVAYDLSNDWMKETATWDDVETAVKLGAKWQKEHLWKPADGDDLPGIDREVIVLTQKYPLKGSEYAVSFAHRPYKGKYIGKSLTTGNIETFENKTYDKSGWNIPDVKWWLDCGWPNEEE